MVRLTIGGPVEAGLIYGAPIRKNKQEGMRSGFCARTMETESLVTFSDAHVSDWFAMTPCHCFGKGAFELMFTRLERTFANGCEKPKRGSIPGRVANFYWAFLISFLFPNVHQVPMPNGPYSLKQAAA